MKVTTWSVPLIIIVMIVLSVTTSRLFAIPSLTIDFIKPEQTTGLSTRVTTLIVEGVKCVDTARAASNAVAFKKGVVRFTAFASYNRVEITYEPTLISPADIKAAFEGPIFDPETGEFLFNQFKVRSIDGLASP